VGDPRENSVSEYVMNLTTYTYRALACDEFPEVNMQPRVGLRARTDFRVITKCGSLLAHCRGIEISPAGIILDRGRPIAELYTPILLGLELELPERLKPVRAVARAIWSFGTQQAFKFVRISDVDRLILAEHLDFVSVRGVILN
jgi:hypothetical protein